MDGSAAAGRTESSGATVWHEGVQQRLLKDTLIYCAAERYGLDELKRLALRKQGLQSGIQVGSILASARYAYAQHARLGLETAGTLPSSHHQESGRVQAKWNHADGDGSWWNLVV